MPTGIVNKPIPSKVCLSAGYAQRPAAAGGRGKWVSWQLATGRTDFPEVVTQNTVVNYKHRPYNRSAALED